MPAMTSIEGIHARMREDLLQRQVGRAIEAVKAFSHGEDIGERELRKIVN